MREYPAYGRTIAGLLVRGLKPVCVAVLLSARWRYFDHVPKVCIKPDEWAPRRYEFSFLHGMHVVAVPGDESTNFQLAELLMDLMVAAPAALWAYNLDGTVLYDGDFADDLSRWVLELGGEAVNAGNRVAFAEARMRHGQARAQEAWAREYKVIEQRAGLEDALKFHANTERIKDRVRQLFAAPFQESGEPAAA